MKNESEIMNNVVELQGVVSSGFTKSHEIFGEGFYMFDLTVKRLSDAEDVIPIMVSDRLIDVNSDFINQVFLVRGQFRSYNKHEEMKNKLILSVFAREIEAVGVNDEENSYTAINQITLEGYVCKEPIYRKTPLGREICDHLIAVNRPYGKSDYIPCICWGRNAKFASNQQIGAKLCIIGRVQSRSYIKNLEGGKSEERTAYEVSVSKIEVIED